MHNLFVFINTPMAPSVDNAVPLIRENSKIKFHPFKLEPSLFEFVFNNRPCILVISIMDNKSRHVARDLLDKFKLYKTQRGEPERDPSCRIVLVSDEEGFGTQGWLGLGIHEFIMGPILPRPLAFKLERHYLKAFASEVPKQTESGFGEVALAAGMMNTKAVNKVAGEVFLRGILKDKNVVHAVPIDLIDNKAISIANTKKTPVELAQQQTKLVVIASHPRLRPENGSWRSVDKKENEAEEGTWQWEPFTPKDIAKNTTDADKKPGPKQSPLGGALFQGEKPIFDKSRDAWVFAGEEVELSTTDMEKKDSDANLTPVFKTTGPNEVTSNPDSEFKIQEAKVLLLEPVAPEGPVIPETNNSSNAEISASKDQPSQQRSAQEENYLQNLIRKLEGKEPVNSPVAKTMAPSTGAKKHPTNLTMPSTTPSEKKNLPRMDRASSAPIPDKSMGVDRNVQAESAPNPKPIPQAANLESKLLDAKNSTKQEPRALQTLKSGRKSPPDAEKSSLEDPHKNREVSSEIQTQTPVSKTSAESKASKKLVEKPPALTVPSTTEVPKKQTNTSDRQVSASAIPSQVPRPMPSASSQQESPNEAISVDVSAAKEKPQIRSSQPTEPISSSNKVKNTGEKVQQGYVNKIHKDNNDPKVAWGVQDFEEQLKRQRYKANDDSEVSLVDSIPSDKTPKEQKTTPPPSQVVGSSTDASSLGDHQLLKQKNQKPVSFFSTIYRAVKDLLNRES